MANKQERIAQVSQRLIRANDARRMATTEVWNESWESFEQELLERLLNCGPTDDAERYRLQVGIEAARHVKRAIEHEGQTVVSLEKELDHLEGRTASPRA